MNERIKDLALECGAFHQVYDNKRFMVNENFDVEKFARLIIDDCIDIVKPTQHHEAYAQSYFGGVDGLELLTNKVYLIKQHFKNEN